MEHQLTEKDLQKLINKKFPDNHHLLVIDKLHKGMMRPCICTLQEEPLYFITDRSSEALTDISFYTPEDEEVIRIQEDPLTKKPKKRNEIINYRFQLFFHGEYAGLIKINALAISAEMENSKDEWGIAYSEKYSLGYAYKYTVYKNSAEAAHFRSRVVRQYPYYMLDYAREEDQLFLIALFVIHSVFTNKKPQRNIIKEDRLARNTGLFGL